MTRSTREDQFKQAARSHLPGLLVMFNLADAKRRNCHLNHFTVDEDIERFDRLLKSSVGDFGVAKRVSGVTWLATYPIGSINSVQQLLNTFEQQQNIRVGWRCTALKGADSKIVERTVQSTIVRGLRCIYSNVSSPEEMNLLIEELLSLKYSIQPNVAIQLSDHNEHVSTDWACVTNYPTENPTGCPFCEKSDIDWEEGDDTLYSGGGTCNNCSAYISIEAVDELGEFRSKQNSQANN